MRNIFLEKSSTKCGGETSPNPSLDQQSKFYTFVFIVSQVEGYQNTLKLSCRYLLLPYINFAMW